MANRREDTNPELGDLQIGCSWIPTTPAKPNTINEQPICTNWQENQYVQSNFSEAIRLPGEFRGEAPYHNIPASYISTNSIGRGHTWQGGVAGNSDIYGDTLCGFDIWQSSRESSSRQYGESLRVNEKFFINDVGGWANMSADMSFVDLLALADKKAALLGSAVGNAHFVPTSGTSDPRFYSQQSSQSTPTFGNSVPDLNSWPGEKFVAEMNSMPDILMDGRSVPSLPWFDPNSAPISATDAALRKSVPSEFEPITPGKTSQVGHTQDSADIQDLSTFDVPAGKQMQENHNPDKGGTVEADSSKTPQQKPRRRKHRPKVVIEGQAKRTPKARPEKPSATPGPTPVKRKYVRRKGVNKEGETNGTDSNKQASTPIGTPGGKRKYTRRKGIEKPEVTMDKGTTETDDPDTISQTRSCRKSLNFNSGAQVRDESSSLSCPLQSENFSAKDLSRTTVQHRQGKEVMMEKSDMGTAYTKGKCQIVFSDVTHDKEEITVHAMVYQDGKWMPRSDTFSSNSFLTPIGQGIGLKRQHVSSSEAEPCIPNATGTFCKSVPAQHSAVDKSDPALRMHLPAVLKRKKSAKEFDAVSSVTNQGYSVVEFETTDLQRSIPAFHGTQCGQQVFEDLIALEPTKKMTKRRPKASSQQDLSSPSEVRTELPVSPGRTTKKSKTGKEINLNVSCKVLEGDTCSTLASKKLAKKRVLVNSTAQNIYNHQEFASTSMGSSPAITLRWKSLVDSIADQLNQLNLNADDRQVLVQNHHCGALVPYHRGGDVVLYDHSLEKIKKRKERAKVDLDDETSRVWRLLLENIDSEGIDGTDEEKMKYWEEERRVFTGRAQSFIARMHLIQGDRRFSPWKGSVVDSVVGVFLTQNVSDHLSSSAFMSLASRFPPKPKTSSTGLHEAGVSNEMKEPLIYLLDSDGTVESSKVLLKPVQCEDEKNNKDFEAEEVIVNTDKSHESASNKSTSLNVDGQDIDEAVSSQNSVITSHNSPDSPVAYKTERTESCSPSYSEEETATRINQDSFAESISFLKLLEMAGKRQLVENLHVQSESLVLNSQVENLLYDPTFPTKPNISCSNSALCLSLNSGEPAGCLDLSKTHCKLCTTYSGKGLPATDTSGLSVEESAQKLHLENSVESASETAISSKERHDSSSDNTNIDPNPKEVEKQMGQVPDIGICPQNLTDVTCSSSNIDNSRKFEHNEVKSKKNDRGFYPGETSNTPKSKGGRKGKEKVKPVDWDALRKEAQKGGKKERTINQMDALDWEAVRCADVNEIADAIKERGMNNVLAERIKGFLERLVKDHESIDLEWLRDVEPDKAKEYLLSFRGLGLKSVECVRLLTLHHLAFPVDTNVARIAVRLGWAPLQPLPESLQLHLLELYPIMESIQKYLWPRLCKLDQKTLYELHYQMITFGKVFCTKSKPNCNACPMRGECRHFASAFASARFALPAPEDKSLVTATENNAACQDPMRNVNILQLPSLQANSTHLNSGASSSGPIIEQPNTLEPIIEVPATPEPECTECDIEDAFYEDPDEIPTIQLNMEEFTQNLQTVMQQHTELQEGSLSRALVALTPEAASIPVPKLKNISRLRTEHQVYQLPDEHPLLEGVDKRETDDPFPYLLAIWTPGETADSIAPPGRKCSSNSQDPEALCSDEACLYCNSIRELNSETVRGTLLIPCRTAMKGSFPLNGTYFQVNEVFSDHESSLNPIDVPRKWLWHLQRRTVFFGTSIPTIFKGQTTEQIQHCFWRGFVCVRGFDRISRAPRPLMARLHFPASKSGKGKGKEKTNDN